MVHTVIPEWPGLAAHILDLEAKGLITRTFRRLDPPRQQAVLDAVLEEAAEKGPNAINIKSVASRAGVSVGSLYMYFTSRQNLYEFASEICLRFWMDMLAEAPSSLAQMPLREALSAYLVTGVDWSKTSQGLLQYFGRAAYQGDPELAQRVVHPLAAGLLDVIRALLKQAEARGEIRPGVDLEAAARLVHALTIVVGDAQLLPYLNNYFQVTADDVPPERALQAMLDLVMHGIGKTD